MKGIGGRAQDAADRRAGGVAPSLGHPQQSKSRLWFRTQATCIAILLLGRRELSSQAVDLALSIERGGRRLPLACLGEALVRVTCLGHRLRPSATELHDFRAMHKADPGESDH